MHSSEARVNLPIFISGALDNFGIFGPGRMWSWQAFAVANGSPFADTDLLRQIFAKIFGKSF